MTARVALFRAREDAARSAARLRRLGFAVAYAAGDRDRAAAVRAVRGRATTPSSPPAPRPSSAMRPVDKASPLFVVGARTARAAESRGWRLAAPPAPDAARLDRDAQAPDRAGRERALSRRPRPQGRARGGARRDVARSKLSRPMRRKRGTAWQSGRGPGARLLRGGPALFRAIGRACGATGGRRPGSPGRFAAMAHVCLSEDVAEPLQGDWGRPRLRRRGAGRGGAACDFEPCRARISFGWALPYIEREISRAQQRWSTRKARTLRPQPAGGAPVNRDRLRDPDVIDGEAIRVEPDTQATFAAEATGAETPLGSPPPDRRAPGALRPLAFGALGGMIVSALAAGRRLLRLGAEGRSGASGGRASWRDRGRGAARGRGGSATGPSIAGSRQAHRRSGSGERQDRRRGAGRAERQRPT